MSSCGIGNLNAITIGLIGISAAIHSFYWAWQLEKKNKELTEYCAVLVKRIQERHKRYER